MKDRKLSTFILLVSALVVLSHLASAKNTDLHYHREAAGLQIQNSYKWFMSYGDNFPSFLYNLCALYYVVPDCLGEMFGDEFDIESIVEDVCA